MFCFELPTVVSEFPTQTDNPVLAAKNRTLKFLKNSGLIVLPGGTPFAQSLDGRTTDYDSKT
jgi:hypothetical protein